MQRARVALVAAVLVTSARAAAQSNYRAAPVGGRSQLLGGTGLTYGRDAAAAFLNPATAVLVDDNRLSFSVNFYTVSFVNAPRWYTPGPIDRAKFGDLTIESPGMTDLEFNALPSSLCIFFRGADIRAIAKDHDARTLAARFGFCLATIQGRTFSFGAEGFSEVGARSVTRQAQTLAQSFTRFAAGPTYAMQLTRALSIGASFHGSLATHRSLLAAAATTYGSSPTPINSQFYTGARGDAFQLEGIVGATYRTGRQTWGLSVKTPSLHVYGVGGANEQSNYDGDGSATSVISADGSFTSTSPLRVGIGTGFEGTWGLFEFNALYHMPLGRSYRSELRGRRVTTTAGVVEDREIELELSEPARGVVNFAAGLEVFLSPKVSVLSGLATDLSSVKSGALRGNYVNYYPYRTDHAIGSFGIASHGSGGELMVGGEISIGWGERLAVNSYQLPPVIGTTGHGTYQLMLVVAGSTSLRALKRAVDDVTNLVKEPKKPDGPYNPRKPAPSRPKLPSLTPPVDPPRR